MNYTDNGAYKENVIGINKNNDGLDWEVVDRGEIDINNENVDFNICFFDNKVKLNVDSEPYIPSKYKNKQHKVFKPKIGDWYCFKCGNINFRFREKCNICQELKVNQAHERR